MAPPDSSPAGRSLAAVRRLYRFLLYTFAVCVGIGLAILVLVGTRLAVESATGSRTFGSLVALLVFGMVVALPVYWLADRDDGWSRV